METTDDRYYLERLREALLRGDTTTDTGQAVARLKEPFALGDGTHWHYERFVALFATVRQALAAIDDSITPDLPPFLLEPGIIARVFDLPLEDFNWQGAGSEGELEDKLDRILAHTEVLVGRQTVSPSTDWLSIKEAAALTGLSAPTIRRAILSGALPATNKGSKRRPLYRVKRADLVTWMNANQSQGGHPVPPRSSLKDLIDRHLPGL
jgi:excisionase family DNA binding protein